MKVISLVKAFVSLFPKCKPISYIHIYQINGVKEMNSTTLFILRSTLLVKCL